MRCYRVLPGCDVIKIDIINIKQDGKLCNLPAGKMTLFQR